jgi:hypothetical protein
MEIAMPWNVDGTSMLGILALRLEGSLSDQDMADFVRAHNEAIDGFAGRDYRIFCDIRELKPLSPTASAMFEKAKAYSAAHPNFQGSAVWVSSATIAMQHRRTSTAGGVMDTELISQDERACRVHLSKVRRAPRAK